MRPLWYFEAEMRRIAHGPLSKLCKFANAAGISLNVPFSCAQKHNAFERSAFFTALCLLSVHHSFGGQLGNKYVPRIRPDAGGRV